MKIQRVPAYNPKTEIEMFGKMFRAFSTGANGAKAIEVLMKTYSLQVSQTDQLNMMHRIAQNFAESLNEHEMAVQFLAEFSATIKTDHPRARSEVEKYIRMSKGAYARGLASMDGPQERLFKVARERFGIEPNDIKSV